MPSGRFDNIADLSEFARVALAAELHDPSLSQFDGADFPLPDVPRRVATSEPERAAPASDELELTGGSVEPEASPDAVDTPAAASPMAESMGDFWDTFPSLDQPDGVAAPGAGELPQLGSLSGGAPPVSSPPREPAPQMSPETPGFGSDQEPAFAHIDHDALRQMASDAIGPGLDRVQQAFVGHIDDELSLFADLMHGRDAF